MTATVRANKLVTTWVDATWGQWSELTTSKEFTALTEQANDKLGKAGGWKTKGKGKGKNGKKGGW